MFIDSSVFEQPADENEKIWRYVDFTKFISTLETKSLYFSRADKFADRFEGSYPQQSIIAREQAIKRMKPKDTQWTANALEGLRLAAKREPKNIAINCWHMNPHESVAMWQLYLASNEGIAIQSTYRRLRDCIASSDKDIMLGQVKYIDFEIDKFDFGNVLSPFAHKRRSFEHEREVRAIIWTPDKVVENGVSVSMDLNMLVERVYVAPDAPAWFENLVKSVLARYAYGFPVFHSDLNKDPLY